MKLASIAEAQPILCKNITILRQSKIRNAFSGNSGRYFRISFCFLPIYITFAFTLLIYRQQNQHTYRQEMRTGILVGSFDPYTIGHDSLVKRALPLFDKIVIGVGFNERKKYMQTTETRVARIKEVYKDEPKVEVKQYNDLTVDFARREGAGFIIKGVRSLKDFEYEREQADINRQLTGIETVLFFAEAGMESISSSVVRELAHFGKDVRRFLP